MTDVGKIKLAVEIDASQLSEKLGEAVRKAIAPALLEIQRELNKVQEEYDKTAVRAADAATVQKVGAKQVAEALDKIRDKQLEVAAASKAAADSQDRDIRRTTRDWEEQTAAIAANTAARLANAAAPTGGGPGRGGGGPGRGGRSSGGSHRGGVLGFLTGPTGLNAIALGAQAIPAALTGVTALVGAVVQLGQAGLGLPAIYGAVGASFGVAFLGVHGLKDAITALNKAAASGDPKDLKKVEEALKDLDPAAAAVARTISGITQGPLKDLEKMVQGKMFAGFDRDLQGLADKAFPKLKGNIGGIADAWNATLKTLTGSLGADKNLSLFDRFLGNTAEGQKRANGAIDPIIHAFSTLLSTGGEFLPRLGDAFAKVADRFDAFISKAGKSGQLWKWIDEGLNGLRALGNAVLNIGKTLTGLVHAEGGDGGFLGWLERVTGKMSDFVNSADGQGKLRDFFNMGKEGLHQWGDLFKVLGPALLKILEGFATWGQVTLPIITALANIVNILGKIPGLVEGIVVALLAFKTITGVNSLLNSLTGVSNVLGGIPAKAGKAGAAVGGGAGTAATAGSAGKGGRLAALGGLARNLALIAGLDQLSEGLTNSLGGGTGYGNWLQAIGGGAATGAAIGSGIAPGPGTAIGAIGGAVFGGLGNFIARDQGRQDANRRLPVLGSTQDLIDLQNQTAIDQSLYGASGSFDPRRSGVGGLTPGSAGYNDLLNQIRDPEGKFKGQAGTNDPTAFLNEMIREAQQAGHLIDSLGDKVTTLPSGEVVIKDPTPEIIQQIQSLGVKITTLPGGQVAIDTTAIDEANRKINAVLDGLKQIISAGPGLSNLPIPGAGPASGPPVTWLPGGSGIPIPGLPGGGPNGIPGWGPLLPHGGSSGGIMRRRGFDGGGVYGAPPGITGNDWNQYTEKQRLAILRQRGLTPGNTGVPIGHAGGGMHGMLPGYSPGIDNMMVPLSGGEGIVIPEAMRALGPDWLYGINSKFRSGISKAGYAGGGIHGYAGGGIPDDTSELGVLLQIRDLLSGKGGVAGNPLAATARSTDLLAQNTGSGGTGAGRLGAGGVGGAGTIPSHLGPFGTPVKAVNPAYDALAAIIKSWGGDPERLIGSDPAAVGAGGLGAPGVGGLPGAGVDFGRFSGALSTFAHSGNLADVAGLGLGVNSPVISALTSARNKKKGGLSDDDIGALIEQIVSGGGFTGTLDSQNTPLVKSLQRFRDQLSGGGAGIAPGFGAAGPAAFGGSALGAGTPGSANALIAFAQAASGGKYAAASDLVHGLADCSGAVSDLVEFLTKGQTTPGRLFSTHNEAAVLQGLGAVPGLVPGSLQIGLNPEHTAATLPNGVNFESGGSGGGVVYGGPVGAGDKQFTQQFSLPTDMSGQFGGAGYGTTFTGGGSMPGLSGFNGGVVPVYVTNMGGLGGAGGAPGAAPAGLAGLPPGVQQAVGQVAQAGLTAAGQAAAGVSTDVINAAATTTIPGQIGTPTARDTALATLVKQGNPLAIAKAAGLRVPDYTRQGGPNDVAAPTQGYDATGRVYSDTSALVSRTFTSLGAQIDAMRSQVVDVTGQVVSKLGEKVLAPVVSAGVTSGFSGVSPAVFGQQGTAIGKTAAPIIADAVSRVTPSGSAGSPVVAAYAGNPTLGVGPNGASFGQVIDGAAGNLFAGGGLVSGGTPGIDSVPILAQQNEWVLNTDDVARLGGAPGVARFIGALRTGKLRKLAAGGSAGSATSAANANNQVGADFFGVSQIPIIGTIVNLLVQVLLKVLGVQIDVRNTLNNIGGDFRSFRGDAFKAFDAQGRLLNDTSALVDRSNTSQQTAADERVKILKIVIEALIKYIIEKVIVPIAKAVANTAISAAASAAGSAVSAGITAGSEGAAGPAGGIVGGIVSSAISSAGAAAVDIVAEVTTDFAVAISSTLINVIGDALQSILPGIMTNLFGGKILQMILGPIGSVVSTLIGGFLGSIMALFTGLFGGAATLIPGIPFDDGGMAHGVGFLPKATMGDELVLSPRNTDIFTKFVGALNNGGFGGNRTVHAPITVMQAGPETADQVQNRLLRYMP